MSVLLTILSKAWPYVLCSIVAGYLTHRVIDAPRYNALQAEFKGYQAKVTDADDRAQKAANDALEAQIQSRLQTEANNGKVISQLQNERDAAVSDRDFARRLLAAAKAQPPAGSSAVSTASGGRRFDDPAGASGDRSLAQDLGDAAGECRNAIQRLAALQAELKPQLK
jgi:hypothetical protein